jgi:CelD/BcsL family acetyltransferase involved in cellulose biosynthesis
MTTYQTKRLADLTAAEWSLWEELQRSDTYESPYFRPEFVRAVADVRDDVEVASISEDAEIVGLFPFQRSTLGLGKPIGGKLSDYHGPLLKPGTRFDASELLAACRLATWDFDHLVGAGDSLQPFTKLAARSPQMHLADGYAAYVQQRRQAGSDSIHRQGQKIRKLAREVGELQFDYDCDDEETFELLRSWKSAQLARSGLADVFAFRWVCELLQKLREIRTEAFSAPLTVLRAGSQTVAVCLSLRSRGVLHSWFTAYNPELSQYSPGLTLFLRLAEEAGQLGICKIDLGRGEERYKWSLASGSVEVAEGSITRRSLATLLRTSWRQTRDWMARSPLAARVELPQKLLKPLREWLAYH